MDYLLQNITIKNQIRFFSDVFVVSESKCISGQIAQHRIICDDKSCQFTTMSFLDVAEKAAEALPDSKGRDEALRKIDKAQILQPAFRFISKIAAPAPMTEQRIDKGRCQQSDR